MAEAEVGEQERKMGSSLLRIGAGVAAVAISARYAVPVPGTDVPQSMQTLCVVLVGAFLGGRDGALALMAYIGVGGLGLPVFADGGSGWAHVAGSTGGFLAGFVVAAGAVGAAGDRGQLRRIGPALAVMLGGHALILFFGWAWLATSLGPAAAFRGGVAPFLLGGAVKAAIAVVIVLPIVGWEKASETEPSTF